MTTEDGHTDHLDTTQETTGDAEALPDPDAETLALQQLRQRQIAAAAAEQLAANAEHEATLPPSWVNQSGLAWYSDGAQPDDLPAGIKSEDVTAVMWKAITGSPRPSADQQIESWDGGDAIYRLFPPIADDKRHLSSAGLRPIAVDFKDGRAGISLTT